MSRKVLLPDPTLPSTTITKGLKSSSPTESLFPSSVDESEVFQRKGKVLSSQESNMFTQAVCVGMKKLMKVTICCFRLC